MSYKDPAKDKAYQAEYRAKNREKVLAWKAKYRAKNREKVKASQAEWRANNPAYEVEYRVKNREKLSAYYAEYQAKNRNKIRAQTNVRYAKAIGLIPDVKYCQRCVINPAVDMHHIDQNYFPEDDLLIEHLCKSCHKNIHYGFKRAMKTITAQLENLRQ